MLETDFNIINVDKVTYAANPHSLDEFKENKRYSFIKADICDKTAMKEAIKDANAVIHFAAESHVDRSLANYAPFVETNISGTINLLQQAADSNIKKFVHISTDEVYGQIINGTFSESDLLSPRNPYSASKASAEMFVNAFRETYGVPTIITRSANNYGPYQFPEKMLSLFVTNLLEGKKVPLYGEGKQIREWTFVEDNCEGLISVLEKGKIGEIYNISSGEEMKNIDFTKLVLKKMGYGEEMIQKVEDRKGHDFRYSIDSSKVRALGWKPKHTLEEGLDITIKWYKENKKWWEPLKKELKK